MTPILSPTLEICVDSAQGAQAAVDGGADRIELCSSLSEGGLTPSAGFMQLASTLPVPVYAMIRPRAGMFHYSARELDIMVADIQTAKDAGIDGVVLGAQDETGALDIKALKMLVKAAGGMGLTLHRVIDVVPDAIAALDHAVAHGFDRVLTSGGAATAPDGVTQIAEMVDHAKDRISIMAGSGITANNVRAILQTSGVTEIHASCAQPITTPTFSNFTSSQARKETDSASVKALVQAMLG